MISEDTVLNKQEADRIFGSGYTRIPVCDAKGEITSLLFVKDLAMLDPEDNFTVTFIELIFQLMNQIY